MSKALLLLGTVVLLGWSVEGCSSDHHGTKDAGAKDDASPGEGGDASPEPKDSGTKPPPKDSGTKPDTGVSSGGCGTCPANSTCDTSGSTPKCVCTQDGYALNGKTGSKAACVDIDECADAKLNDCDPHATCTNTDGSYECACDTAGYKGDGKSCACAIGYSKDDSGDCKANDAKACAGDGDCVHGHCVSGVCCASACDDPGLCKTAEGATCKGGTTCKYPPVADDTACDDGNACTANDKCSAGSCLGDGSAVAAGTKCRDDDMCGTDWHCDGETTNTCVATTATDCTGSGGPCASGECDPKTGCYSLTLNDGTFCVGGDACYEDKACHAGNCEGGTLISCSDNNPCTDDGTCTNGACPAPVANTATCDDGNPCTVSDHCADSVCGGSVRDCADTKDCTDDSCDSSITTGDPCVHTNDDTNSCSDGKACTANDVCQSGTCVAGPGGAASACGHATACTEGNPIQCTCEGPNYVPSANGDSCVPATCSNANPCVAEATCGSTAGGSTTCTCPPGSVGDGKKAANGGNGCTPCGTNEKVVGGACVCDLTGTFAIKIHETQSWNAVSVLGITVIQAGSMVPLDSWAIRKQSYDAQGNLSIVTIPCGGETPDLCGGVFNQNAYSQYEPAALWGTGTAQNVSISQNLASATPPPPATTFAIPNAAKGAAYQEPQTAALIGIHLTNPMGTWPLSLAQIAENASKANTTDTPMIVNGAYWDNNDSAFDNSPVHRGVTAFAVPPGGRAKVNGDPLNPPENIPANSPRCSLPYAYWPDPDPNAQKTYTISQFYVASRVVSNLSGTISASDCDTITGTVRGPVGATDGGKLNGKPQSDSRLGGCAYAGTADACTAGTINTIEDQYGKCANANGSLTSTVCRSGSCPGANCPCAANQTCAGAQRIDTATFTIKRIAGTLTCADVRAMSF